MCSSYTSLTLLTCLFFFFTPPPSTHIYTLSLHDALPILSHEVRQQASHVAGRALRDSALPSLYQVDEIGRAHVYSSHLGISYAVFCLKKKKKKNVYDNASHENTYSIIRRVDRQRNFFHIF